MSNSENVKVQSLIEALGGDISIFHSSMWYWNVRDKEWHLQGGTQIYPCPGYTPNVSPTCYCGTPIRRNYLIIDNNDQHYFVGSECIKLFGGHYKTCVSCGDRYRGKYRNCKSCRASGKSSFSLEKLWFGKHKGKTPEDIAKIDKSYIKFLFKCDALSDSAKEDIATYLLPAVNIGMGKYRDKSFQWIKHNDPDYYEYLRTKAKWEDCPHLDFLFE